ncbi:hypothetical protein EVAR_83251_1 [Eumeta japonica]|uniref:Uncharacterized protein n=1 Tax=Eumeta variegata TaxID=151549 RepID=A0A4C1Y3J4_EUMVA|nr:hypothetical protein EVAR_83251_1 [Eumeta japonica]
MRGPTPSTGRQMTERAARAVLHQRVWAGQINPFHPNSCKTLKTSFYYIFPQMCPGTMRKAPTSPLRKYSQTSLPVSPLLWQPVSTTTVATDACQLLWREGQISCASPFLNKIGDKQGTREFRINNFSSVLCLK